jgi:SnoaL-like domain
MPGPLASRLRDALGELSPERPESVEGLRALYDPSVVFRDPIQTVQGLDAFLAMNLRLLGRARALSFEVTSAQSEGDEIFLAWTMRATPKIGPRIAVEGVTHATARAGRVVYHRDFWDLGELFASAVPGAAAALRVLLKPLA